MTAEDRARVRAAVNEHARAELAKKPWQRDGHERLVEQPPGVRHGSLTAYCNGCRCDDCRTAARNAKRRQRRRKKVCNPLDINLPGV